MNCHWQVRLTASAELDFINIIEWTVGNFGKQQAKSYSRTLMLAIEALHDGPNVLGVKQRDDIKQGVCTLHVAREGRKGRHFVVFRETTGQIIEVIRLLHDSMEMARHVQQITDEN